MRLLYFAALRERLGCASEDLALPEGVVDVAGLLELLRSRGGVWELALATRFRVAVNQQMAQSGTPLTDADEVALFPPVTGG
jgi:molybdopterin converting factor subunit 1